MNLFPKEVRGSSLSPAATTAMMWGGGALFLLLLFPAFAGALMTALGTGLGIVLSILAILLLAKAWPYISLKLSNGVSRALSLEARTNPVETRQYVRLERLMDLGDAKQDLEESVVAVETFRTEIDRLKNNYPADAARFQETLEALDYVVKTKEDAVNAMQEALRTFDQATDRVSAIWRATQAQRKAMKMSKADAGRQARLKMLEDETVQASDEAMIRAISAAKTARALKPSADMKMPPGVKHMGSVEVVEAPALPNSPPVSFTPAAARVPVGRSSRTHN